jgi:hypothetical protein
LLFQGKCSSEEVIVIYGGGRGLNPTPKELSRWVRGHWEIENSGFWVLDVRIMLARLVVLFMLLGVRR